MTSHKNIDKICIIISILALALTILFINADKLGVEKIVDEDAESYAGTGHFTSNDLNGSWDTDGATYVTCDGSEITISGNGAYAYDGSLYISNAGCYVITGTLDDGFIDVDAYDSSKVWILLDNVNVASSDNACLRVDQADKVFLTLADGSVNVFTGGESVSDEAEEDGTNGVIYAHDDLTINGSGTLTINGSYYHGIKAKDDLTIAGGVISITVPQDGIHVNNDFSFANATLTISAGDDGIHADEDIYVESGTVLINECYEGMEASTIEIAGGDVTVYPDDDGFNANGVDSMMGMGGRGGFQNQASQNSDDSTDEEDECYILISGGNVTIINENGNDADGLDSNKDLYVTGGNIYISLKGGGTNNAIDYGSENNGVAEISGGTLVAAGGHDMAEAFDSTSSQPSIFYTYTDGAEAGTRVILEDSEGNVLVDTELTASFTSLTLSCPEMQVGESYVLHIGDVTEDITLEETSGSYGDATGSGFGGMMKQGGMQNGMQNGKPGEFGQSGEDGQSEETGESGETGQPMQDGQGFGGRGGHGMGGRGGKMMNQDGERPELPEGFDSENGERPELPEGFGSENGEMPELPEDFSFEGMEDGERPELPEGFDSENGEMPEMSEMPEMTDGTEAENDETMMRRGGGKGQFEGGQGGQEFEPGEVEDADTQTSTLKEVTAEQWLWIAVSLVAVIAGIIFIKAYKTNR